MCNFLETTLSKFYLHIFQIILLFQNCSFYNNFQEREEYLKQNLPEGKQTLTADEMSVFYKSFLDKNWKAHITYNLQWYKKNVILLKLAFQVRLRRLLKIKD